MNKGVFLSLIGLLLGLAAPKMQVEAAQTPVSHGNLIYGEGRERAGFYAADIHLLDEKISSISDRCFDPACYTHVHQWEYCQINERTHTKHCAACGEVNDLTSAHRPNRRENETIYYEGKTYPGSRFTCECGYQWTVEQNHTPVFEKVDEQCHRSRCALDKTSYCEGCESFVEEHYTWFYEMEEDDLHHVKICFDCGAQIEESCSFREMDEETRLPVCICGRNAVKEEGSDTPATGEPPEIPDASDTPDAGEGPEEPNPPQPPGTGEEPEEPDPPQPPGTGEEPEEPDPPQPPDTGEEPEEPNPPQPSGTGEEQDTSKPPDTEENPEGSERSATPDTSAAFSGETTMAQYGYNRIGGYRNDMSTDRTQYDNRRRNDS